VKEISFSDRNGDGRRSGLAAVHVDVFPVFVVCPSQSGSDQLVSGVVLECSRDALIDFQQLLGRLASGLFVPHIS
jgi:hypothetical protein